MSTTAKLFAPGPTEMAPDIRALGAEPLGYFRSEEYCADILALTEDLKWLFQTRTTPLTVTSSGTGGMEMAIANLFNPGDRVVTLNGGTFGAKWTDMCRAFGLEATEIAIAHGQDPDLEHIDSAIGATTRGLFVTAHETSTGYAFDVQQLASIARAKECLVIVDAVSSIGADPFAMDAWGCDCVIACSQKALACMPGLAFIAFSDIARARFDQVQQPRCYYDARTYFDNIGRGMLPFTPAMHATSQVKTRLAAMRKLGLEKHLAMLQDKARRFRSLLSAHPGFSLFPQRPSNALSAMRLPDGVDCSRLVGRLKNRHGLLLPKNPTGSEHFLRVSHMGDTTNEDFSLLAQIILDEAEALLNPSMGA